jgi:hypothetical protein
MKVEPVADFEEARKIAKKLVGFIDQWRSHEPVEGEDKAGGLFAYHEDVEPVARAYLALLARAEAAEEQLNAESDYQALHRDELDHWKQRAEAAEELAAEWEAWLDDALKALGAKTVFDIKEAGQRREAAEERERGLREALEGIERGEDDDPSAAASNALEEFYGLAEHHPEAGAQ